VELEGVKEGKKEGKKEPRSPALRVHNSTKYKQGLETV